MEKDLCYKKVEKKRFTFWGLIWIDTKLWALPIMVKVYKYQFNIHIACIVTSFRLEFNKK